MTISEMLVNALNVRTNRRLTRYVTFSKRDRELQ